MPYVPKGSPMMIVEANFMCSIPWGKRRLGLILFDHWQYFYLGFWDTTPAAGEK